MRKESYQDKIEIAREFARKGHRRFNRPYGEDNGPYEYHLQMVEDVADKFNYLLPDNEDVYVIVYSAIWLHDYIEDSCGTYSDVKKVLGIEIAEIALALQTYPGRNRDERNSPQMYENIRNTKYAIFVKICDRIANITYSKRTSTNMYKTYKKEQEKFKKELYIEEYKDMWDYLDELLNS